MSDTFLVLAKHAATSKERALLSDFLGFLQEKGWRLGTWSKNGVTLDPVCYREDSLIHEFLEIDGKQLEIERRKLLGTLR